jgi:hypothetical protein
LIFNGSQGGIKCCSAVAPLRGTKDNREAQIGSKRKGGGKDGKKGRRKGGREK